jgi:hypothetical protein
MQGKIIAIFSAKNLAYFDEAVSYTRYTRQYYKTFYGRNLEILVKS